MLKLGNANRLADGRYIFKNKDGDVLTEDNEKIIDPVLFKSIVWKDGATTQEEYAVNRDQITKYNSSCFMDI